MATVNTSTFSFDEILGMSLDHVWEFLDLSDEVAVMCDDGVLAVTPQELFIDRICWQMFDVLEKDFPSSNRYSVKHFEHVGVRTHLDICGLILKDYVFWKESRKEIANMEPILKRVYEITNDLDNEIDNRMDAQVTDICFDHLLEIYEHEEVAKTNSYVQLMDKKATHEDIQEVYTAITTAVLESPKFSSNPLCVAARCGVVKMTQLCMVLGPIGFCTDINSKIINHPITVGFFRGMRKLDDFLYESRNASIAALFNIVIMPLAEYANRRYQLPCEYVKNIAYTDCGAASGKVFIQDKQHLRSLAGFRITDDRHGNFTDYVMSDRTDLIGKHVFIRDPNYCRYKQRDTICHCCMGLMHYSFPYGSVIGHIAATQLGSSTSTVVLQRKHQNLTSQATKIVIDEVYQPFFKPDQLDYGFKFADNFDFSEWSIVLKQDAAGALKEIQSEYFDSLNPSQTTKIEMLELRSKDGLQSVTMPIGFGQRAGFLSKEALEFYREKGWTFLDGNLYQLDLDGWNNTRAFLNIPQIEFTPPDLITSLTEFIFSGSKDDSKKTIKTPLLVNCHTVDESYATFYDLTKEHLKGIHSVHLMLIILAMSVQDASKYDYRLPYPREHGRTVKLDDLMRYRSLSGAMAYEEQNRLFLDPITYLVDRRPAHIYDSILMG